MKIFAPSKKGKNKRMENKEKILELQKEFVKILTEMGATCEVGFVDKDNNVFEF